MRGCHQGEEGRVRSKITKTYLLSLLELDLPPLLDLSDQHAAKVHYFPSRLEVLR